MLCDICKKNEATIHIKEMHNNKCTSINLCAECAKMNELKDTGEIGIDLAQMFLELGKAAKKQQENAEKNAPAEEQKDDMPPCPICSWTQSDIRKNNGKFGCPVCYTHYKEMAEQTFRSIQKGPAHIGKHAAGINEHDTAAYEYTLAVLEKSLARYVAEEDYESAAKLRDGIARLKKNFAETGKIS